MAERTEILLREYEVSQSFALGLLAQAWQVTSIIVGGSVAGLGFLISLPGSCGTSGSVALFSAAVISILILWRRVDRRWQALIRVTYGRMQEIEAELGMRKNQDIDILDRANAPGRAKPLTVEERFRHASIRSRCPDYPGTLAKMDLLT